MVQSCGTLTFSHLEVLNFTEDASSFTSLEKRHLSFKVTTVVKKILMYSTRWCPFCVMAKRLLAAKGVAVEEVAVDSDPVRRIEMVQRTGRRTVPQIFIGETHIGGFEEMAELDHKGELDPLLTEAPRSASPDTSTRGQA